MRFIIVFVVALFCAGPTAAAERVALVIGNGDYAHTSKLRNPRNDAEGVAAALERFGFEVITAFDADRDGFQEKVRAFGRSLRGADAAVFYYADHGLQVDNNNFLIPVDAQVSDEVDLDFEAVELASVLRLMQRADGARIVFLDACRDNPMARSLSRSMGTRSSAVGRGLARVETGTGSLIAFSTAPGEVALDGRGQNSPFTAALLEHIDTSGLTIDALMNRVRQDVVEKTNNEQVPWSSSSLTEDFYFLPPTSAPQDDEGEPEAGQSPRSKAAEAWDNVKNSKDPEMLEVFIKNFPNTIYADFAQIRIRDLKRAPESVDPCAHRWPRVQDTEMTGVIMEFLRDCPTGPVADTAKKRLELLRKREDEREWNKARERDTISSYNYYLQISPDGAYADSARKRRRELRNTREARLERRRERRLWQQAKRTDNISAYEDYLDEFPRGTYSTAARQAIARLEQRRTRSQQSTPTTRRKRVIVYNKQDFYGSDLYRIDDVNFDNCKQRCLQLSRCRAFTYNTRHSVCFLKHSVPVLQPYKYAISGKIVIE
jgi:hypothetical protein